MPAVVAADTELWSRYADHPDQATRDELIAHYLPLVRYVASRVAARLPQNVEHGDLISYGVFGLIDAIEKFDLDRGFKFETYAVARIKGAILDELRSLDWVPRSIRAKARAVDTAWSDLEGDLHRTPTRVEVADELDMSGDQFAATLNQISLAGLAALDELVAGGDGAITLGDTLADVGAGPVAAHELDEIGANLACAIGGMLERERVILTLYYRESLTLADIGVVLGVTESRVCQIHTKAIMQLCVWSLLPES